MMIVYWPIEITDLRLFLELLTGMKSTQGMLIWVQELATNILHFDSDLISVIF